MNDRPFDIETAIATWRHFVASARGLDADDLDELEIHLRDEIDALLAGGITPEEAFHTAGRRVGDYATIEAAYSRIRWEKLHHEKKLHDHLITSLAMLKNNLKIVVRTMWRDRSHAAINVAGLTAGLTCFILILVFARYERSYDRFFDHADRIYRVVQHDPGDTFKGSDGFTVMPAPLAPVLREQFPGVEAATALNAWETRIGTDAFSTYEQTLWTDAGFFEVFSFQPLYGDLSTALDAPNSVVLTASVARKYFGDRDPVGETMANENADLPPLIVTAVVPDVPPNAHLTFGIVRRVADRSNYERQLAQWSNSNYLTYFKVKPGVSAQGVVQRLMQVAQEQYAASAGEGRALDAVYEAQPLTRIHLHSHLVPELGTNGSVDTLLLFLGIGIAILLIACVNYVNLATARAGSRGKEVGVRKALGARHGQLVRHYLVESMLVTGVAFVASIVLAYAALPAFGAFVDRVLGRSLLFDPVLGVGLVALFVVVSLLAGGYPAFVLARTRAVAVLKQVGQAARKGGTLRNLLVVGQFAAAVVLLVGTVVIYRQLRFVQSTRLGFDREHVVMVELRDLTLRRSAALLRSELARLPGVAGVSISQYEPYDIGSSSGVSQWEGHQGDTHLQIYRSAVDPFFLDVMKIGLVAGTSIPEDLPEDEEGYLLNETAVKALGWSPQEAVGRQFRCDRCRVYGVVKDFHFLSLHQPMAPLMLQSPQSFYDYRMAFVRLQPGDVPAMLASMESVFKNIAPAEPFDYRFMDDAYDAQYRAEQRLGQAVGTFAAIAVVIACLGLFGLAAFTAQRRTKEIGIRKVLGASARQIVVLLSRDFVRLVAVGFILAVPVAYFAASRWLQGFAFRIDLSWPTFAAVGLAALCIAFATTSYQAIRAATTDPAQTLRYE